MDTGFGDKVRDLRKAKGFTLKTLAAKSGIELTYLSKIENSKTGTPAEDTINKLAKALGLDDLAKQELFRLGSQLPADFKKDITQNKLMFNIFRSSKGMSQDELQE